MSKLKIIAMFFSALFLSSCSEDRPKNWGSPAPKKVSENLEDFFSTNEKTKLFFPETKHSTFQKTADSTLQEFQQLVQFQCKTDPKPHPKLVNNLNQIWVSIGAPLFLEFSIDKPVKEITHLRFSDRDALDLKVHTSSLLKAPENPFSGRFNIRKTLSQYKMTPISGKPGSPPFVFKRASDSNVKVGTIKGFPQYGFSDSVASLKKLALSGFTGTRYDKGIYMLADGKQFFAFRVYSVEVELDQFIAWQNVVSNDIGNLEDAVCRAGLVKSTRLIIDQRTGDIKNESSELELIAQWVK